MWILFFAAAAAVIFWACCVWREHRSAAGDGAEPDTADTAIPVRERLEAERMAELIAEVVEELRVVMEHPQLGGPGYFTAQFPRRGLDGALPTVSCQYPNINEALYRRVVRRELDPRELAAAGVPAGLASRLSFAVESGGIVVLTAEVGGMAPEMEALMAGRGRDEALYALAEALGRRYPGWTAQALAGEILLTPAR